MNYTHDLSKETPVLPPKWSDWTIVHNIKSNFWGKDYVITKKLNNDNNTEGIMRILRYPYNESEAKQLREEYPTDDKIKHYYKCVSEYFLNEIQMVMLLKDCIHVVHYIDYEFIELEEGFIIYIQMDVRATSAFRYIYDHSYSEKTIIKLGIDIANVLTTCNAHNIVHGQIRPNTILFDGKNFLLDDFSFARQNGIKYPYPTIRYGASAYYAPEMLQYDTYDACIDQYALGIILYILMNSNREPFLKQGEYDMQDVENARIKRYTGASLTRPINASKEFSKIILKACDYNPSKRYSEPAQMLHDLETLYNNLPNDRPISIKKPKKKRFFFF